MKKICYIICITLLSLSIFTSASADCENTCSIESAPAPVLSEYLENIATLRQNVITELSSAINTGNVLNRGGNILQSLNDILNFGDYIESFDYYIVTPLLESIPSQVRRDHDLVKSEGDKLLALLETAGSRGNSGLLLGDICEDISNCNFEGYTVGEALTELIKNNEAILRLYRGLVTSNDYFSNVTGYLLVSPNFQIEMKRSYNAATIAGCSKCAGEFSDIVDKITDISGLFEGSWEEARNIKKYADAVFTGQIPKEIYEKREKELLEEYLAGSGVSTDQANIMLGNLERYNAQGLSLTDPSLNQSRGLESSFDEFTAGALELFDLEIERVPYVVLTQVSDELQSSENLKNAIATMYANELPYALAQDVNTQTLQARMIRMHFSLVRTANLLEKKIPDSEKLCDKQGRDLGRCNFDLILK